ncbi:hypothetical protein HanHA300_Chr10g0355441 [Helianthus annuus]|nr:hypothetical protein HanHA300_Chr10g0355441 [Helianthus annuus]KAJ0696254.1 hypothetical protein HanLR1_Chr10g0354941 [Helianthus annuus]
MALAFDQIALNSSKEIISFSSFSSIFVGFEKVLFLNSITLSFFLGIKGSEKMVTFKGISFFPHVAEYRVASCWACNNDPNFLNG